MSIEGRINVDVLFHDKDGTASLKVVGLKDSDAYTNGRVAIMSGTCNTTGVTLLFDPTTYRDASGQLVSVQPGGTGRVAFLATGNGGVITQTNGPLNMMSRNHVCVSNIDEQESVSVVASGGTTHYTVVVWSES